MSWDRFGEKRYVMSKPYSVLDIDNIVEDALSRGWVSIEIIFGEENGESIAGTMINRKEDLMEEKGISITFKYGHN